ncbi:DEAD/DEAH box helicase [Mycolicibacterium peregrinum]|uniref:DEAD/DEAH box helicase n=1 Tax=Mycolicibacterium peregrinum TaxID=43304 RepID=UPI003AABC1C8
MDAIARESMGKSELLWLAAGLGSHGDSPSPPETVVNSLKGAFTFREESQGSPGLRTPQIGALHAILARRSIEDTEPMTVVMPTGTGKTETMLAAYCHSPKLTLVVVPSDALRTQIAGKFTTLGILPQAGVIGEGFVCPVVLVVKGALGSAQEVDALLARANVVVATVQALLQWSEEARLRIAQLCDRLFVDEAHHVAANTWRSVADLFSGNEIVQFTATPYREDGQHLGGRVAYVYPLHLAQENGYFARINYHSIVAATDTDRSVASAAVQQLRADLAAGKDHLLMARVSSVERAKLVIALYEELAPDLLPLRIDTGLVPSTRIKHRQSLDERTSRIVVCVNMLGEGFDLPALKVAAIHDPQKSLAATLQFIGRFTRVGNTQLGDASAFVPLQIAGVDDRLRKLYGEDADWNEVLRDVTERAVGAEQERSDFEASFGSLPHEIALRSIRPKMSTVTYRSPVPITWSPDAIYDLFEDRLLTTQLGINNPNKVIWWVTREATPVRWGEFSSFNELVHHLYVVHVDDDGGFLYVNSSNNATLHQDIAKAIGGDSVELISGEHVYRILAKVARRVPINVGLLDAVSRTRRFSMHVGQDVLYAWEGEGGTKMKTNIFAHGFSDGKPVSYGASRKGRIWSHEEAQDIHDWVQWARQIGPAVSDTTVSLESVMSGFLLPTPATKRPAAVPLSIEWPHELVATISDRRQLVHDGESYPLIDTELRLTAHSSSGPLSFEVVTPRWSLGYAFQFRNDQPPLIVATGEDGEVVTSQSTDALSTFLTRHGVFVTFEDEMVLVEQGFLLHPDRERRLFPREAIEVWNWTGIDIKRESQGPERNPETIQYRAVEILTNETEWEIVLDDDGSGELADIVMLRRIDETLEVLLAHCKFSSKTSPGARIGDLYDVCGQAMKMNRAKSLPDQLIRRLVRRESDRQKDGRTGLLVGEYPLLTSIAREARLRRLEVTVAVIQPGMSREQASEDMRALLGATDRFLQETHGMRLRVIASP